MENITFDNISENHKLYEERLLKHKSFGYDFEKEREILLKQILPLEGKILEIGTGKGHFAIMLAKAGYSFTSIDISSEEQRFAYLNLKYYGLEDRVELRIEDAEKLSYPDASFDVIVSVNLIHHLQNPFKVIDEILRVIKPGGRIIICDFSKKGFQVIEEIHKSEGRTHEINNVFISDIIEFLSSKKLSIKKISTDMQEILIVDGKIKNQ